MRDVGCKFTPLCTLKKDNVTFFSVLTSLDRPSLYFTECSRIQGLGITFFDLDAIHVDINDTNFGGAAVMEVDLELLPQRACTHFSPSARLGIVRRGRRSPSASKISNEACFPCRMLIAVMVRFLGFAVMRLCVCILGCELACLLLLALGG